MDLHKIDTIAKSIQPFIKGGGTITLEGVYKIIMTNNHLDFIKQIIHPDDIPLLVFVTYEISAGNYDEKLIGKIKNNLYVFNTYEFGETTNDIDCDICGGSGEDTCSECDGNGYLSCDECGGDGTVECENCEGSGEVGDDETCPVCDGNTDVPCKDCDGDGHVDCPECRNGNVECYKCDGNGTETIYNRVPYTVSMYVSYDLLLRDEIESFITQNKDFDQKDIGDKTLTLNVKEYTVTDSETETVDLKFANKNYFGKLMEMEPDLITRLRDKLTIYDLDYLEEKFEG